MAGDANYASVGLLLHGNGADGGTVFTDNSPTPKTVTGFGGAKTSTAVSEYGGSSILLNGSSDYLTTPGHVDFNFPGDFTVEFSVRFSGYSAAYVGNYGAAILATYDSGGSPADLGWQIRVNGTSSSYTSLNIYTGKNDLNVTGLTIALNTRYRFTVCRSGSTIRVFQNGALVGTLTNSDSFTRTSLSKLYIGRLNDPTYLFYLNGNLSEVRVTKGEARYTAAFTPPGRAFSNGLGEVEGVVRDDTGALCLRRVRIYRRDTGVLLGAVDSDAATGAYRLVTPTLDEVQRIVLDDAGGALYNDIIDRVIPA